MAEELFGGQDVGATPSYKEQAYRLIKEAILFNRFRVGAIYSQDDICKELGISRTPVREALLELQKDGYVSFSRGKGVQVVPVSDRDARDILETRMYICCLLYTSPRASMGLRRLPASMEPSVLPAPTMVCSSSIKRMIRPSDFFTSLRTAFSRSSNSPRYLAPAMRLPISREKMVLSFKLLGTSPFTIRWASPSAMAVLPTPGSPMRTGSVSYTHLSHAPAGPAPPAYWERWTGGTEPALPPAAGPERSRRRCSAPPGRRRGSRSPPAVSYTHLTQLGEREQTARQTQQALEESRREAEALREQVARLEPDAAAYAAVKDRSAGVELEAHRRAQGVLDQANSQARHCLLYTSRCV